MRQTHKWTFPSILKLFKTSLIHSPETTLSHTSVSVCANSCLASCSSTSSLFILVHFSFICRKILWHNVSSMHPIIAMVSCKKSPLRSSILSWAGGVSLGHLYFDAQNSWIKSVSPLAFILWRASDTWINKGLFFLTAMDAPDIAKGSPPTLISQRGSFLHSYSRPTWSATKTSRLLFIKINMDICLLLYGESFVDNRNGFRLKILKNLKKKEERRDEEFPFGNCF